MAPYTKKRTWFELGARACADALPGKYAASTYLCPLCLRPFSDEALNDGRLSVEHVPPESVGGRELLLTCKECNNSAGTKLDASVKTQEDVRLAMSGGAHRPHRVKATIGGITVNGRMHAKNGSFSLTIPRELNRPGTSALLQELGRTGAPLVVEHERYSRLGANIGWLRAGYLALVAMEGYRVLLDPAMDIVRKQIIECDERRMMTFVGTAQAEFPLSIRRVLRVIDPAWHRGWTVQFGQHLVNLPSQGDMNFYDRLAEFGLPPTVENTTYEYVGWPTSPTFGLDLN